MKAHILVACNGIGSGMGAVSAVAHRQCIEFDSRYKVSVVCGELSDRISGVDYILTGIPQYNFMRRFSHVVREVLLGFRMRKSALDLHRKHPVAVAVFHNYVGFAFVGRALQKNGVKTIVVTHGDIFSRPPKTYDLLLTGLYRWATRIGYRESDRVQALSPFMHDQAVKHGAPANRVVVIPNGIDLPPLFSREMASSSKLRLLFVGRISIEKDLMTLLKATAVAFEAGCNVSLTVIGEGDCREECELLCEELGCKTVVKFCGQQERSFVAEMYRAHDVLCVPSISDPLPTVVLEAMVYGLPVIGSNVDGIPYMLSDQSGALVDARDVKGFSQAIWSMRSLEWRMKLSENASKRVAFSFSWDRICKDLFCVIDQLSIGAS